MKNEYFKEIIKKEEYDLDKFDLAEAIVVELIEKCLESEIKDPRSREKLKKRK